MSWPIFHSRFQPTRGYWLALRQARPANLIRRGIGKPIKQRAVGSNSKRLERVRETAMNTQAHARTYNQNHVARKYTPGKRRLSIYWTWSYPLEAQRNPAEPDNRFSTMTEVRRVLWPAYEKPAWSAAQFPQGIAGTLELFHRSTLDFQKLAGELTGHPVAV